MSGIFYRTYRTPLSHAVVSKELPTVWAALKARRSISVCGCLSRGSFFLSFHLSFFFFPNGGWKQKKWAVSVFSPSSSVLSFSLPLAPPPTVKANKLLVNPRPLIGWKGAGGSQSEGEDVGKGASCCCCPVRKMQIVSGGMQSKPLNYFVESLIESARFSGTVAKG